MIKEVVIFFIALVAISSALPVDESKPEVAVPVAVTLDNSDNAVEDGDDLAPAASAWGGYGYGRGYGGWGGYRGGWGRRGYGWGGYGRGYYGGWGHKGYYWG